MRLGIFLAELRHFRKNRFGMPFEHSELEDQCGVEHHIRFLLERVHPFLFTANDGRTTGDGLLGGETTVLVITYDAAQQTDIGGRNPVMVIDIDGGQCRHEDLKCQVLIHIRKDARIEGMQTFNHQHGVLLKFQFASFEDTLTDGEVISGQDYFLTVQQLMHLLAEERQINGVHILKIVLTVRILRGIHTVDEIVIHGEHLGFDTVH